MIVCHNLLRSLALLFHFLGLCQDLGLVFVLGLVMDLVWVLVWPMFLSVFGLSIGIGFSFKFFIIFVCVASWGRNLNLLKRLVVNFQSRCHLSHLFVLLIRKINCYSKFYKCQ